jgi:NADPH2:quinone reductase
VRAVGFSEFGGPEVVALVELSEPQPGPGEVRVRVAAATVNPTDVLLRSGARPGVLTGAPPHVAGLELAGVVDEVGRGAHWQVGDRVVAMTTSVPAGRGAHAELVVTDARSVALAPREVTLAEATTLPMNGMTARLALDRLDLAPGSTLLVTGAAGAVGGFATQLAAADGLTVIAVARGSDEQLVRDFGAQHFVARDEDLASAVRALAPAGVDAAIDAAVIGAALLPTIREGGRLVALRPFEGESGGAVEVVQIQVRDYLTEQEKLQQLSALVDQGALRLRVARRFAPEEGAAAHRAVESSLRGGGVVIEFDKER